MDMKALLAFPLVLAPLGVFANDYPTDARVQYVFECMATHGGENFTNLYKCSCAIDKIASAMPYDTYVEADTFTRGRSVIGEHGNEFRDPPQGKELRKELEQVEKVAQQQCLLPEVGQNTPKSQRSTTASR